MIIYIVLLTVATVFSLSYIGTDRAVAVITPVRHFLGFFLMVALIILYIWRGVTVGTDYPMYNMFLSQPSSYLAGVGVESGYVWLYGIAAAKQWSLFVTGASFMMTFVGLFLFARRTKVDTPMFLALGVLSFVYLSSFNLVRQMAAMGICFIGLALFTKDDEKALMQRSFWWHYALYAVCVFAAMYFHASAIIALVLPFCMFVHVRPWMVFSGFCLTTLGFLFELGNRIIPILSRFFPHYLAKYSGGMSAFLETGSKDLIAFIPILIQFVILFLIVYYDKQFVANHQWLTAMYFIYLVWFMMAGNQAAIRAQVYWFPATIYFFGRYLQVGTAPIGRWSASIMKVAVVLFFLLYTVLRIATNNSGIYPYVFR